MQTPQKILDDLFLARSETNGYIHKPVDDGNSYFNCSFATGDDEKYKFGVHWATYKGQEHGDPEEIPF